MKERSERRRMEEEKEKEKESKRVVRIVLSRSRVAGVKLLEDGTIPGGGSQWQRPGLHQ
jgi:hypothetical protein